MARLAGGSVSARRLPPLTPFGVRPGSAQCWCHHGLHEAVSDPVAIGVFVGIAVLGYFGTVLAMGQVSEPVKVAGIWVIAAGIAGRIAYNCLVPAPAKSAEAD